MLLAQVSIPLVGFECRWCDESGKAFEKDPALARDPSTPSQISKVLEESIREGGWYTLGIWWDWLVSQAQLSNNTLRHGTIDRGKNAFKRISSLATRWWRRLAGTLIHDATATCMAWQQVVLLINNFIHRFLFAPHVNLKSHMGGCGSGGHDWQAYAFGNATASTRKLLAQMRSSRIAPDITTYAAAMKVRCWWGFSSLATFEVTTSRSCSAKVDFQQFTCYIIWVISRKAMVYLVVVVSMMVVVMR